MRFLIYNLLITLSIGPFLLLEDALLLGILLFFLSPFLGLVYFGISVYNRLKPDSGQLTESIFLQSSTILFILGVFHGIVNEVLLTVPLYLLAYLSIATSYINHSNKFLYYLQKYGVFLAIIFNVVFIYQDTFFGLFANGPFLVLLLTLYGKFYRDITFISFLLHLISAISISMILVICYNLFITGVGSFPHFLELNIY